MPVATINDEEEKELWRLRLPLASRLAAVGAKNEKILGCSDAPALCDLFLFNARTNKESTGNAMS
jgi:hypothetical protein